MHPVHILCGMMALCEPDQSHRSFFFFVFLLLLLFFNSWKLSWMSLGLLKGETVGLSQTRLEKSPPPPSVYLPCILFQILGERCDYDIIMLINPKGTQQMSQDTIILLWEISLDCTEYNKEVFIRACISLTPKKTQYFCISSHRILHI